MSTLYYSSTAISTDLSTPLTSNFFLNPVTYLSSLFMSKIIEGAVTTSKVQLFQILIIVLEKRLLYCGSFSVW